MPSVNGPFCPRHGAEVRMRLRTLHSDSSAPERLTALYECPECGYERRLPMAVDEDAAPRDQAEVA